MHRVRRILSKVLAAAVLCVPVICHGAGFIVVKDPPTNPTPGHFAFAPLETTYHRVSVTVNDEVATTTVEQEFSNPNPQQLEGTFLFPLPAGSHIDKFSMDVNGKMTDAELLDANKARSVYEDIVRRYKDPALLEYAGQDTFKARIFPIPPNGRKQIKVSYTQLLKSDGGLVEYTYPLNTEKFSAKPLNEVAVKLSLASKDPLKSVYSPSHNVEIRRDGENKASIGYEQKNVRPDTDFKVIFSRNKSDVGVDLLTYRNSPDDGYFLLLASPGMQASTSVIQRKDVCFVIDTSGSMAESGGKKMEQARKALSFCLQNLNEGDRFEIVRFSTEAESLFGSLHPATKEDVQKAQTFVAGLKPIGGTAIQEALNKALSLRREKPSEDETRPFIIIFLTDGQPTVGETNEDLLVASVGKQNLGSTRIFSFGIGTDVNTHLLDRIAGDTKAFSQYVLPEEDLEVKLSNFYTKIKEPVLANVQLSFTGSDVKVSQMYPGALPDLFKGEVVVAFGRYSGKGAGAAKVTGTLNGEKREFVADVKFAENDLTNAFIPRLWATRRVGWLLDEMRLHGESTELKDECTRLAREHGIVTPYTAYLILEDEQRRGVPVAMQNMREFGGDGGVRGLAAARFDRNTAESSTPSARSGSAAVDNAEAIKALKGSSSDADVTIVRGNDTLSKPTTQPGGSAARAPASGYKVAQNYTQQARVINGRAFYQNNTTWTDSTAQSKKELKQQKVQFNSDEYFALLKKHPEAAQWFALGNEVDVVLDNTLYMVR